MTDDDDDDGRTDAYAFDLPPDRIAQRPAERRDHSRLMVLEAVEPPRHAVFADLPDFLRPGDLLIRNDTRVFPARLLGRRPAGGRAELLLIRPLAPEAAAGNVARQEWLALARPAAKLRPGSSVAMDGGGLAALVGERDDSVAPGAVRIELVADAPDTVGGAVERLGQVPLPPYIRREGRQADAADRERYQTVYAGPAGAVAAPTAGLHFTPELDAELARRGVELAAVTLHVGPGTFRPVEAERLADHRMDAEWFRVPPATREAVARARAKGGRIVAVGTTSARALEAAAEAPETETGWTRLFIRPGYRFRTVDGLVTNFHLPRSSLLALVSALAGRRRLLDAYREAVAAGYRFYSYGDAMLLWRK